MAVKRTHEDLLKACREGDSLGLTVILGAGLPMKGFPLEESPLWALSMGFSSSKDIKPYGGYGNHFDNKLDCLALLSDRVDFTEHDYAALKNIHKQTSLYTHKLAKVLPKEIVVKSFNFTAPEDHLEYTARADFHEYFCELIDRHLRGELKFDKVLLREAFKAIALRCELGSEPSSILMANKMISNGLGGRGADGNNEDYMSFTNVVFNNCQQFLPILIKSGEFDGIAQSRKGLNVLGMLYTLEELQPSKGRSGAFKQLLKSLSDSDLHNFCNEQVVIDQDGGALVKTILIERGQTDKAEGRKTKLKF